MMSMIFVTLLAGAASTSAADWPVYHHDDARSAATDAVVEVCRLKKAWVHSSPIAPQPAWDATAKQDAYHKIHWLPERRLYDAAFEPIIAGRTVYFGSSADDSLYALALDTGRIRWRLTVGGAIRIAPAWHEGRLYFGSDDGFVYCVDAGDGHILWKFTAARPIRLVLQDGRFVSPLACRTGVVVRETTPGVATAYFCQSLLPWDDSYLCAVDARTGRPTGEGRFVRRATREGHFDGPMAVNDKILYCPRGNTAADLYTLREGIPLGGIWAASGGCFALFLPEESRLLSGGMAYQGHAALLDAPIGGATGPVKYVHGAAGGCFRHGILYLQMPESVQASRRESGVGLWSTRLGPVYSTAVTGDAVLAGGEDRLTALDPATGKEIWQAAVRGRVYGIAAVAGTVIASTDRGEVTCFRSSGAAVAFAEPPVAAAQAKATAEPPRGPAELRSGPLLRYLDSCRAEITWETAEPSPTILEFGQGEKRQCIEDKELRTEHRAVVGDLLPRHVYSYRIRTVVGGREGQTGDFPCDGYLNYSLPLMPAGPPHMNADDPAVKLAAERILRTSGADQGLCLVLGAADRGALAWRLTHDTRLRVLIVDRSAERIEAARQAILTTGAYGARVSALQVDDLDQIPLPNHVFRLIVSTDAVSTGKCTSSAAECRRLLDPRRGFTIIGQPAGHPAALKPGELQQWLKPIETLAKDPERRPRLTIETADGASGRWTVLRLTGGLPGAADWTHQYAGTENTACSNDTLQGATAISQMTVQWLGRPGGRYQVDRMVRKPAPLAVNGRLLMQGHGNFICLDSTSGAVLWTIEMPGLFRYNMVRDASNYCTDGTHVYVACKDRCWVIDLERGGVRRRLDVPLPPGRSRQDWSYVAAADDLLLGSATTPCNAYTNSWGGGAWYEHSGWDKVCSNSLFAYDTRTLARRWQYTCGAIVNTTIAAADGRVYFLESRQPGVVNSDRRLLNGRDLWTEPYLVALDLTSGKKVWERSFPAGRFPPADVMCGIVCSGGKVIFHSSSPIPGGNGQKGFFHLLALDAISGADAWRAEDPWPGFGHGSQTSYPVAIGNRLFCSPHVYRIDTGERLPSAWREGHCGTSSASAHALFYRFTTIACWDIDRCLETRWPTVRPDCWLSTLPAEGLLLAPEGGGGCVCAGWLETSVAMAPRTDFAVFRTRQRQFLGAMEVELDPPVGGGATHFTIDGSPPTGNSPRYEGPIQVTATTTIRTRVFGGENAGCGGPETAQTFARLAPANLPAAGRVEFQPVTIGKAATGDLVDVGEALRIQAGGSAYGWRQEAFDSFWAVEPLKRKDAVRESVVWLSARNRWEIALANGEYDVTILVGHPDGETKRKEAGAVFVADGRLELNRDLAKGEMGELTRRVHVTDGKLRLHKDSDDRTSIGISWLEFRRVVGT